MKKYIKCSNDSQISENEKTLAINQFIENIKKHWDVYQFEPGQYGWFDDSISGMKFIDSDTLDWNNVFFYDGETVNDPDYILDGMYDCIETIPDGTALSLLKQYGYDDAADMLIGWIDEDSYFHY